MSARILKFLGAAIIVGILAVALSSMSLVTERDVAAAHLACAEALAGEDLLQHRDSHASMGVVFADKEGGVLVGYERYARPRWLCAVTTDSGGHTTGAVRL
jgi:hypothetical protein